MDSKLRSIGKFFNKLFKGEITMEQQTATSPSLKIEREFNAPIDEVYKAWTIPENMSKWMGPGDTKCEKVDIDLKVGGKYRIQMISNDCDHSTAIGEYQEIIPNQKLVFTWTWEGSGMPDTLVTITLKDLGDKTLLQLHHQNFPDAETCDKHQEGWDGCLESLFQYTN